MRDNNAINIRVHEEEAVRNILPVLGDNKQNFELIRFIFQYIKTQGILQKVSTKLMTKQLPRKKICALS